MAVQLSVTARNARLDAIETAVGTSPILRIRTGAAPANCAAADAGTVLAEGSGLGLRGHHQRRRPDPGVALAASATVTTPAPASTGPVALSGLGLSVWNRWDG